MIRKIILWRRLHIEIMETLNLNYCPQVELSPTTNFITFKHMSPILNCDTSHRAANSPPRAPQWHFASPFAVDFGSLLQHVMQPDIADGLRSLEAALIWMSSLFFLVGSMWYHGKIPKWIWKDVRLYQYFSYWWIHHGNQTSHSQNSWQRIIQNTLDPFALHL